MWRIPGISAVKVNYMARPSFLNVREIARRLASATAKRGGGARRENGVRHHLRRAIQLETLENRHLMAGNVAGTVFNDLNANGADDAGENGIAGVTVFIDANGSGTLNPGELSTVTDNKGKYNIPNVPAGVRDVYEIPPSGFIPTPGFGDHRTVQVLDNKETRVKFGNVAGTAATGNIAGNVFVDANENGISESGEDGLVGWTMFIDNNGDGLLTTGEPTAITDIKGDYLFTGVSTGNKTVYEIPQGAYRPIVGGLFPTLGVQTFHTVTVQAAATVNSDFANKIIPIGNIQGSVTNDTNGDGIRGATEVSMSGITVYVDVNNNLAQDAGEPVRTTNATGAYSFIGIRGGSYRVTEVLPATFVAATSAPSSVIVDVFGGSNTTLNYFNLVPTVGSIAGKVYNDLDGSGTLSGAEIGLAGWQVYVDQNSSGTLDAGEPQTTTAADGSYLFANRPYGLNTIRDVVPAGWAATNPATSATVVALLNGENRTGVNLGNREKIGTIQGTVWNDDNGDGIIAATEVGLADRTVYLDLNSDGNQDASEPTAVTNAAGVYQFNRVAVGTYQVAEVLPASWVTSIGKSNKVSTNLLIGAVNTVDFYNVLPRMGSVSGLVFSDLNLNGVQEAGEAGMQGMQLWVDSNNNSVLDAADSLAITDSTGQYTIANVSYGNTVVHEVLPAGYSSTNHAGGVFALMLLNGENRTGIDFATKEPIDFSISGIAYFDANHNGIRDASERGLSGIKVYIDANNNGQFDSTEQSTITSIDQFFTPAVNELGTYSFGHLPRGTYTVREIVPSELDATPEASRTLTFDLGPASKVDANFADIFRANEIHGVVFDDTNSNHVYDTSEAARSGVTVYIDSDRNDVHDVGEPTTVTGPDGSYSFTELTPGAYIVREDSSHGPKTYPENGGGVLWPAGVSNAPVGNVSPTLIQQSLADGEKLRQTVSLTLPNTGGVTNMVDVFLLFDDTGSFTANSPIVRAAFPTIISRLQAALPGIDLGFGVGRFEEYGNFGFEFATGRPFILNQPIVAATTTGFQPAIQSALDRMAPGYGGDTPETDIEALYQMVTGLGFDGNNNGSVLDSGAAGLASTQIAPGDSGDVPSFASFQADPANGVLPSDGSIGGAGFRPGALPIILTATDTGFAYQPKNETNLVGAGGLTLPVSSLTDASRASTPFGSGAGLQETITGLNALGALVVGLGTNPEANFAPRKSLEALAKLTGAVNQSTSTIANGTADPIAPGDPLYFQISSGFGTTVADGVANAIQNAATTVALDITVRASDPRVHITNFTGTLTGVTSGQTASFDVEFTGDGRPHRFDLQFVRAGTNVVIGSIPVVLGTPVAGDHYSYDELEDGEIHHSSHFGNYIANVAPTFVAGSDVSVQEDAGPQSVPAWATSINAGAAWETKQALNFIVTSDNPTLFSAPPAISPNGTLTFTPAANANGTATVVVQLHDNGGVGLGGADTSAAQTFVISVASVSDAPIAAADSYTTSSNQTLTVPVASGVLANDIDGDGDAITAQLVSPSANGSITLSTDGSFSYVPNPGFFGTDSFTYQASDGTLTSAVTTVALTIDRANAAPVAVNDSYSTNEDVALNVAAPGVLSNDSDADGDPITATVVTPPAHGTVTLSASGALVYTPTVNYSGADSFTYSVSDGRATSGVATVSLTIIATNRAPVAADDAFATNEDTPLVVAAPGVLTGDSDADGDALTAAVVTGPAHGSLLLAANGSFTYTPAANYNGSDSFTYKVKDGQVDSNIATVVLTVNAVNDVPVAGIDTFAATEDTTLNIVAPGVLVNDSDAEGSLLVPTLVRNALHGTVTLSADGSFQYVPVANYSGADSFTYSVSDGSLSSLAVTVNLNVAGVNDAPVAAGNSYTATEDVVLSIAAPGVLVGDSDVDGNTLRALVVAPPTRGSLSLNINGSFVYTPSANLNGPDTFTYKANDGSLDSNVVTVTINVAAVNDAPLATADSYSTSQNAPLVVPPRGVLNNDTDGDGDVLSATLVTGPAHGTLTLNADGSFSYTPTAGYNGPDSFTYQAADAGLTSAVTTVSITVLPPPPPSAKFFVVDQDRSATYQYSATGTVITNNGLNSSNKKARGIASNSTGTTQWVVDNAGSVFVYDNNGTLLGSWQPQNVGKPEGITVWGNSLWLVDPTNDRVYFFSGGAALRTGRVSATSSFALNSGNLNSTDIVSDGAHLWVVNNTTTTDKVFRYTTAGVLEGSWTISTTNANPSGITLDPTNVNHLWIVDPGTDRIYQYDAGTARLTGSQEPSISYALASTNTNPQGIADPLMVGAAIAAPSISSSSNSGVATRPIVSRDQVVDSSVDELSRLPVAGMKNDAAVLACRAWGESDSAPMVESEKAVDEVFGDLDELML